MRNHQRCAAVPADPIPMPSPLLAGRAAYFHALLVGAERLDEALRTAAVERLCVVLDIEGDVTVGARHALALAYDVDVPLVAAELRRTPPRGRLALLVLTADGPHFGHVLPPEPRATRSLVEVAR